MFSKYSVQQLQTAAAAMKAHEEKPYVSHEWEELVLCLSHSSDPQLRERMYREMDDILEKDPGFKIFRKN
jgi:hypothetical protein